VKGKREEKEVKVSPKRVQRAKEALAEIQALKKELELEQEESEERIKVNPREVKKARKALAKLQALREALGLEKGNPEVSNLDLLLFLMDMSNKLSWLLGAVAVTVALLIAIAMVIF